jgi:alpha-beta hydrolase superfamily lysophospholipase
MLEEVLYRTERRDSVTFKNNGAKLFGIFHRPLAPPPYPTVVFAHGLAGHKTGRYRVYVDIATELSKRGVGVFRFDFRGSGDSEGDFESMLPQDEVSDLLRAIEEIKKDPEVDANSMGLFGRSFGGTIAVLAAAQLADIKSIALWAPLYSAKQWSEKFEYVKSQINSQTNVEEFLVINGQLGGMKFFEELFKIDLEPSVKKLNDIPLLHIHGLKDSVVLPTHANDFELIRKNATAPTKFLKFPETDHDFTTRNERFMAIRETAEWFALTLRDM